MSWTYRARVWSLQTLCYPIERRDRHTPYMIFFTSLSTQYQIDLERPPILKISHRLQSLTIIDDILIAEIRQKQFMLSPADTDLRGYKTATLCYANVPMVQI